MNRVTMDDFKNYTFLSGLDHAPDGKHAGFVLHQADMEENLYRSNLHILEVATGKTRKLTAFNKETSFLWQDEAHILFSALRDPKDKESMEAGQEFTQIYRINIHGGEADKYLRFDRIVQSYEFLKDGRILATVAYNDNHADLAALSEDEKKKELERRKEEKDYEVLEEIPYWSNGGGFTSRKRSRLALFHADGTFDRFLTSPHTEVEQLRLSSDKETALIITVSFKDKAPLLNEVHLFKDGELKPIPLPAMSFSHGSFLTKDLVLFSGADFSTLGLNENRKFYTYNLVTEEFRCITPDLDLSQYNSVGSDCRYGGSKSLKVEKEHLYFITTEGISANIRKVDAEGNVTPVTEEEGSVDGFSLHEGNLLFIGMESNALQEIYTLENGKRRRLTEFNTWVRGERTLASPEPLSYDNGTEYAIDGFVLRPPGYEAGKKYPTLLEIHGGPKTVYGSVFYHELQYFANEGYVVVFCNPRGSDGKGNDFSDIRGKYGTIDYEDLMGFLDTAIAQVPEIDTDRLFVTGGSYGGFMTNWIVGHTHRFRAAASQRSIANWTSMFGTTDIGYYFADDQNGATPWSDQEKLWWHSPMKYADQVRTPTLILHSEEDYRCWITEGLQMFTALKFHGVDSRFCMFRGENHELSRSGKPKHRLRRLKELTDWFQKYR